MIRKGLWGILLHSYDKEPSTITLTGDYSGFILASEVLV